MTSNHSFLQLQRTLEVLIRKVLFNEASNPIAYLIFSRI